VVVAGYPEKFDMSERWPASLENYNSALVVNADGETIANYKKSFLDVRDEAWAFEGPDAFFNGGIKGLGNVVLGIGKISALSSSVVIILLRSLHNSAS
jgi:protein N-terminal amidase